MIFLRRNMHEEQAENPINPDIEEMIEKLKEFFDIKHKTLTSPTLYASDLHLVDHKTFDELQPSYQRELLELREDIAKYVNKDQRSNLPLNFMQITERVDYLLADSHAKGIQ